MKLLKYLFYVLFMLVWISIYSAAAIVDAEKEIDTFTEKHQLIFKKLDLEKDQAEKIRQLLKDYNVQADKERKEFSSDVAKLIKHANTRRKKLKTDIESLLTADQKEAFIPMFKLDRSEQELFTIKEALILDPIQTNTVEYILLQIQEEYRRSMPKTGVRGPGRPPTGRISGKDGDARMRKYMNSILKRREAKKARKIKKILTKEQIKRQKEFQKIRKKQIQEMLQGMEKKTSPPPF